MPTATLPQVWRGRSGREYVPAEGARVRHGGLATVRKVQPRGAPIGTSTVGEGAPLALKLWMDSDDVALEQMQAEAEVMIALSGLDEGLPCPRLFDVVGAPMVVGLITEWCPADLERWWLEKLREPDAFGRLMATLSEVSSRVDRFHRWYAEVRGLVAAHGDLKPANILLGSGGRWLISDFGAARVKPPDANPVITSKVVGGTENFLAPEALFHAEKSVPAALDTWSLVATAASMLRLRRHVLDGAAVPSGGTANPRFRMQRSHQIVELYARDPGRFQGRPLQAAAFEDPEHLPAEDRRSQREALRGVFGEPDEDREQALFAVWMEVLDRGLSIDPARRFPDAAELGQSFERLLRVYLELAAPRIPLAPPAETSTVVRDLEEARSRADRLRLDLESTRERLQEAEARLTAATFRAATPPPAPVVVERVVEVAPRGLTGALMVLGAAQIVTVLLLASLLAIWALQPPGAAP